MRRFATGLLLVSTLLLVSGQIYDCSNGPFNLTALAGQDLTGSDQNYNYLVRVCGLVLANTACSINGASACQLSKGNPSQYVHTLAQWDNSGIWSTCTDPVKCPQGGVVVSLDDGDECNTKGPRSVQYIVACDPNSESLAFQVLPGADSCSYIVLFSHSAGCDGAPPTPPVNCTWRNATTGAFFDLSPLSDAGDIAGSNDAYLYLTHICGTVSSTRSAICGQQQATTCQFQATPPNSFLHTLDHWDTSCEWSECTDASQCPAGGVEVKCGNGDPCGAAGKPRTVVTRVACDPASESTQFVAVQDPTDPCNTILFFNHVAGCGATVEE